jgi:DNA-3-methyladenine glycosylase II
VAKSGAVPAWANDAADFLRENDPVLAAIIAQVGPLQMAQRPQGFQSLVRAIIFQQLAGRAAQAIYDRFVKLVGNGRFPTPALVLAASEEDMRRAGLSRGKMAYIRDLAQHVQDGILSFRRFARMADEEIIAELVTVRGIGRWTAEMFLMFNLRRPDVLPVDDLGFRSAVARGFGMNQLPTPNELRSIGERWRPYRTAAVWYFWQSTRLVTMDSAAKPKQRQPRPVKRQVATAVGKTAKPQNKVERLEGRRVRSTRTSTTRD